MQPLLALFTGRQFLLVSLNKVILMSVSSVEAMTRIFREQHRQMIEEQKKLLDDYKQYFDGVLRQMEEQERLAAISRSANNIPQPQQQEDVVKEIGEIGALLDDAIKTYGKELAEILMQLTERQQKKILAADTELAKSIEEENKDK